MEVSNYAVYLLDGQPITADQNDDKSKWGTDITRYVSALQMKDDINALSTELSFTYLKSDWDKYVPELTVGPGMQITLANNGNPLFTGRIVSVDLSGAVTAYESGWFLGKSNIVWQASDTSASEVIKSVVSAAGVVAGEILELSIKITQTWIGATPAQIIDDVLTIVEESTGETYQYYVRCGRFYLRKLPTDALEPLYKPAGNVSEFPITWAIESITGGASIESMVNYVSVVGQSDDTIYTGAVAKNDASISRYGMISRVITQSSDPGDSELRKIATQELTTGDALEYKRTVRMWGSDEIMSGDILLFNSEKFGLKGNYRVTSVTHDYEQTGHLMSCDVVNAVTERSTNTDDSVTVYGLPDDLGQTATNADDTTTTDENDGSTTTGYYMGGNKLIDRVMQWADKIVKYAAKWQVPADLVGAIIFCESSGYANPGTRTDGADRTTSYGLMQVKPVYMTRFNPLITSKPTDPDVNIDCGCGYLRYCLELRYGNRGGVSAYTEEEWRGALGTYGSGKKSFSKLHGSFVDKRFNLCPNQLSSYSSCKAGNYKVTKTTTTTSSSGDSSSMRERFVQTGLSYVGVLSEAKAGRQNPVSLYGFGGRNDQWCGWYVSFVASKTGIPTSLIPKTGSSQYYKDFGKKVGKFHAASGYTPRRGDILVFSSKSGAYTGHTGIVTGGTAPYYFTSVEGNSSNKCQTRTYQGRGWSSSQYLNGFFSWWE